MGRRVSMKMTLVQGPVTGVLMAWVSWSSWVGRDRGKAVVALLLVDWSRSVGCQMVLGVLEVVQDGAVWHSGLFADQGCALGWGTFF